MIQKRKLTQEELLAQKKIDDNQLKKIEEKKNIEKKKQLDAAVAKEILENGEKNGWCKLLWHLIKIKRI